MNPEQQHLREVKALDKMSLAELKAKHCEVFGEEPLTRNTKVLREQITHRLHVLEIERKRKEREASQPAEGGESMNASATSQISKLQKMDLKGLRTEYEKVFGKPTKSRNRNQLFAQIARKLQDGDSGTGKKTSIPKPTVTVKFTPKRKPQKKSGKTKKAEPSTADKPKKRTTMPIGGRDARLPKVGTTIERTYKGQKLLVRVLEKGFEFEGKDYRSLSALAKHITGQILAVDGGVSAVHGG